MRIGFADVVLDLDAHTLSRRNEFLHLSPKAFDLLTLLLRARPRMVRRQEIEDQLWSQTAVGEANVRNLIAEIRRVIGDAAAGAIVTHPRVGYAVRDEFVQPQTRYSLSFRGRTVPLREGTTMIGRAADCDVVLAASGVSHHHVRLTVRGSDAEIEDLGSKNGTWLNGERISAPTAIHGGDEIVIGRVVLTVQPPAGGDDTTTLL